MHHEEEIDLEELIRVNIKLTRENNRLLKKMRRAALLNFWGRIVFFLLLSGAAYYSYEYYLKDYVIGLQNMYTEIQDGVDSVKTIPEKFGF